MTILKALLMSAPAEATVLTMDEFDSGPVNDLAVLRRDFQLLKEWLSGPRASGRRRPFLRSKDGL
jgi:hypothetical protein